MLGPTSAGPTAPSCPGCTGAAALILALQGWLAAASVCDWNATLGAIQLEHQGGCDRRVLLCGVQRLMYSQALWPVREVDADIS